MGFQLLRRRVLVAMSSLFAAVIAAGVASAQIAAPAENGPSLQIAESALSQSGSELQLALRFTRAVPVAELQPQRGRIVCVVLSPDLPARRRVCVGLRAGRPSATITATDAGGRKLGPARPLRGSRVAVDGDSLIIAASAGAMGVRLGEPIQWLAYVTWKDGGPCTASGDRAACTQRVPASGVQSLATSVAQKPAFSRGGKLRLLATGDSMIQIVDEYLALRLKSNRGTTVRSDAHISTGISKLAMLDWITKAGSQANDYRPDVTVMFLGANDGFPMRTPTGASVDCCETGWVAEYSRRAQKMMRSYTRGGQSYVYWLTLPTPRPGQFAKVFRAVNLAISQAATRVGAGARVIDLAAVFTPGERFSQSISFRGRTVDARQGDGIHLTHAGADVAATLIIDRLRADRALP